MLRILADEYTDIHALMFALNDAARSGSVWASNMRLREACLAVWYEKVGEAQNKGLVLGLKKDVLPW